MTTRYTEKSLKTDVARHNYYRVEDMNQYYFDVSPRNGYAAVDLYSICTDGSLSCKRMIEGGSPKDCMSAVYATRSYDDLITTREQAKVVVGLFGVDFDTDYHMLDSCITDLLHRLAKKTKYKKPTNANGSLARYFYNHLNKPKYGNLDKHIKEAKFRFLNN